MVKPVAVSMSWAWTRTRSPSSYAYNASTKHLGFSSVLYDTNGSSGGHDSTMGTYGSVTLTMAADFKSATAVDATDPNSTLITIYRVSK